MILDSLGIQKKKSHVQIVKIFVQFTICNVVFLIFQIF